MEGGIKLGKVCGLRQQQRHIPSWNAVIISLSLLPSFPFFLLITASLVPLQQNLFLSQKNQKTETDNREMARSTEETKILAVHT